jgi:deazaflavin-dependent oxidoreductase (nitroreductase family)
MDMLNERQAQARRNEGAAGMRVELTASGTRGVQPPRLPRPLMGAMIGLSVGLFQLLGDRKSVMGRPLLLLTTVGARSGKSRRTLLGWWPDERGGWLVVASNAGSARHPAWLLNMAKNPHEVWIEVGKRALRVRPQSLLGAERATAWSRIASSSPGYGKYQEKTDREIPVLRLTAFDETPDEAA